MPHIEYYDEEGTYYPSVTTILNATIPKPALIDWAWRLGKEGKDYKTARDDAAGIGTQIHDALEKYIAGTLTPADVTPVVKNACIGLKEFLNSIRVLDNVSSPGLTFKSGIDVYSETHFKTRLDEHYPVSGSVDLLLVRDGLKYIIDFKTSNQVYSSAWIQLGGYDEISSATLGDGKSEYYVLHIAKKTGKTRSHFQGITSELRQAFYVLTQQYYTLKTVERLLK